MDWKKKAEQAILWGLQAAIVLAAVASLVVLAFAAMTTNF